MTDNNHGIAGTAHDLVYGQRAKTYGHPRIDFDIIANVWTGLLKDVLKDGARLDPYRVAVMMTGLKLARLVQSPDHTDSRIDTIGYMLTMERLDEVEDPVDAMGIRDAAAEEDLEDSGHVWTKETGDYGDPAESVTLKSAEPNEQPLPLPLYSYLKDYLPRMADREIDKLLGRETAEHSAELDAKTDNSVYGPLTNVHHPVNVVLRGSKLVSDIAWQEGDRLEMLEDSTTAWLYGSGAGLWYKETTFNPETEKWYSEYNSQTFRNLRLEYSPLKVTRGTYKGLILFEDGVGYVAER